MIDSALAYREMIPLPGASEVLKHGTATRCRSAVRINQKITFVLCENLRRLQADNWRVVKGEVGHAMRNKDSARISRHGGEKTRNAPGCVPMLAC